MKRLILLLALSVSSCASVMPQSDGALIFDECKAVDGGSTIMAVSSGRFTEANPLLKGIVGPGWTHLLPFGIAVVGIIAFFNYLDNRGAISNTAHVAVDGITCTVAARNIVLMLR